MTAVIEPGVLQKLSIKQTAQLPIVWGVCAQVVVRGRGPLVAQDRLGIQD